MAEFRDSEKAVRQCLKDCGCDERTAEQFLAYGQEAVSYTHLTLPTT